MLSQMVWKPRDTCKWDACKDKNSGQIAADLLSFLLLEAVQILNDFDITTKKAYVFFDMAGT